MTYELILWSRACVFKLRYISPLSPHPSIEQVTTHTHGASRETPFPNHKPETFCGWRWRWRWRTDWMNEWMTDWTQILTTSIATGGYYSVYSVDMGCTYLCTYVHLYLYRFMWRTRIEEFCCCRPRGTTFFLVRCRNTHNMDEVCGRCVRSLFPSKYICDVLCR